MQLLRFHLVEDGSCEKEIKQGLEKKLDRMVMRDLYGKFKTAPTEEERERARKEYLDRRGVPESFRWYIAIYDSEKLWNGYCCFYTIWYSLFLVYEFVWNNTKNAYFS